MQAPVGIPAPALCFRHLGLRDCQAHQLLPGLGPLWCLFLRNVFCPLIFAWLVASLNATSLRPFIASMTLICYFLKAFISVWSCCTSSFMCLLAPGAVRMIGASTLAFLCTAVAPGNRSRADTVADIQKVLHDEWMPVYKTRNKNWTIHKSLTRHIKQYGISWTGSVMLCG